ncbi:MAG: 1-deoxy-D-xylulose-5-phosphate reductoisomerase [Firmicutes bacterium]|nr:1-deoxy-D-xylulose-5-phosphate reductoisomerase [Bacillota bacterium]
MKKIALLGSTGSIGTQTLEVVRRHSDEFIVTALACGHNISLFRKQLEEFRPEIAACAEEADAKLLSEEFKDIEFSYGIEGLCALAEYTGADIVVNALLGMMGLRPTFAAVRAGKDIAFANKETLVAGGSLLTREVKESGIKLLPVDSEHSAIFQCLNTSPNKTKKILLTASGGPFRGFTKEQLKAVTKEQALKHPNWKMGAKITIDSASMMNKGLEIIEASLLFDMDPSLVEVYVHPQSVVHSAVEFEDGAVIAQMGTPDMKLPIAYALSYPRRLGNISESLNLFEIKTLTFEKPDTDVFKCLDIAYKAIKAGHKYQVVMNAANEEAVAAFLADKIKFRQIAEVIEATIEKRDWADITSLDEIFETEDLSRNICREIIKGFN